MFNRLSNYLYGGPAEPEQSAEERAEEVRRRRLQQFEGTAKPESQDNPQQMGEDGTDLASSTQADQTPSTSSEPSKPDSSTEPGANTITEPHVTGSAVVKTIAPTDIYQGGDDPWGEWDDHPIPIREPENDARVVSLTISRVFGVTLTTDVQPSTQPKTLIMLLDTAAKNSYLSLEILDEVLFERLYMTPTDLRECKVELGGTRHCQVEPLVIPYLLAAIGSCEGELKGGSDKSVVEGCRAAAVRMIGIVLLSNDTWSPQDPAQQLVECLISSADNSSIYSNPSNTSYHLANQVLVEVLAQDNMSSEDKETLIRPVLMCLTRKSTMCELNNGQITVAIISSLNSLIANKGLAKIIPTLPGWSPGNIDDGAAYQNTFLGRFLSCSTIRSPRHILDDVYGRYTSPYFNRSSVLNQDMTQHSAVQYQQLMDSIQSLTSKFLYNLIKSEAKYETLTWLVRCLDANRNKGKLVASFVATSGASDGFMLNLAAVLLKLSTPFLGPENPKLCTIDVRFCAPSSKSIFPQQTEDKILDKIKGVGVSKEELLTFGFPEQFNFITSCFYLTHRALQLAYTAPFDKYRRLMKSLMETQRLLQDMGTSPFSMDSGIRERFETQFVEQLEVKTHLLHPDTVGLVLLFYCSSANWLTRISVGKSVTITDVNSKIELSLEPSKTLAMIPGYFVSAMCDFLINDRYFAEATLENFPTNNMDYFVTFLVQFCNQTWVPNPHTRAKIVEALTVFIPNGRSQSSVSTSNRESAFSSNVFARHNLGEALLSLFVDIEHTATFEHKFQDRFYIFELLQYIWPHENFQVSNLSREVRGKEEDTTVLFTKYLKLLLNDANYLLDEALRNLEEIRKIQLEQDNTDEWNALGENVRESKLKNLAELKRMCTSYNILSYETVNCLCYMTKKCDGVSDEDLKNVTYAFVTPLLVDTLVTMLNYYLKELVGERQTKYKVKNFDEVKFYPSKLLQSIVQIYVNLKDEPSFVAAIPRDGRSYNSALFKDTATKLRKLYVPDDVISNLLKVSELAAKCVTSQGDEDVLNDRAPSNYLDPLLGTLMTEPVLLPSSNMVVDRSVIAKHLLSDPIDPFNRQPLQMCDVIPQDDLRSEIQGWREQELQSIVQQRTDNTQGSS